MSETHLDETTTTHLGCRSGNEYLRKQLRQRNVQRFRGWLVFKARRLCVSLNSEGTSTCENEYLQSTPAGIRIAGAHAHRLNTTGIHECGEVALLNECLRSGNHSRPISTRPPPCTLAAAPGASTCGPATQVSSTERSPVVITVFGDPVSARVNIHVGLYDRDSPGTCEG